MRIIGGHDYYDSALAYGSDNSVVFLREKTSEIKPELVRVSGVPQIDIVAKTERDETRYLNRPYSYPQKKFDFTLCSVIVGGSRWNGVRWNSHKVGESSLTKYIWDWKSFLQTLNQEKFTLVVDKKSSRWGGRANITQNYFGEKSCSQVEVNWLVENRISILTCDYDLLYSVSYSKQYVWKMNGDNLKDMEFYRALDAYSVFQRISQWVGGILATTPNSMVKITDDKILAHKHGFDHWSFRKQPERNT